MNFVLIFFDACPVSTLIRSHCLSVKFTSYFLVEVSERTVAYVSTLNKNALA